MLKSLIVATTLFSAVPVLAATPVVMNGALTGASGVKVGSKIYDVSFTKGTCAVMYDACEVNSFDFQNVDDARLAAAALGEQVFVDSDKGKFGSTPGLTLGCARQTECITGIAYGFTPLSSGSSTMLLQIVQYRNRTSNDVIQSTGVNQETDFNGSPFRNFARFTLSATAVPEPATWAMMLIGFGMVASAGRIRRSSAKITFA